MGKSDLRQKVIRRIKKFEISEEEIDGIVYAGECCLEPVLEPGEPYETLRCMIELLPQRKRYELMCLMYLGRNIEYFGFCEETANDFCFYADNNTNGKSYGSTAPEYLAGKVRIARWLRLIKQEIHPVFWQIGIKYDEIARLRLHEG